MIKSYTSIASFKSKANETATVMSHVNVVLTLGYKTSVIHVIINRKIAHVCETDQMMEFHIACPL